MRWNEELSPEQVAACSVPIAHRCLLAGPGTGKTRVITHRVAWLGQERDVPASRILVLTFTRAAAAELRQRLVRDFGDEFGATRVSTIHAFALRQLVRNGVVPGTQEPLVVADDYDEHEVIWPDLRDRLELEDIDAVKDALIEIAADYSTLGADDPDWARRHRHAELIAALDEHKRAFRYMLRSELVYRFYRAMVDIPEFDVERFDHLLVDEYQDLTPLERRVISLLVGRGATLYAAGDDDQAIYGWRGSSPDGVREFEAEYGHGSYLRLEVCQRCDRDIVGFSQAVIVQDLGRTKKHLGPRSGAAQGSVLCRSFADQVEEAEGVAQACRGLRDAGRDPGKILVLIRSRPYAGPLLAAVAAHLPVASTTDPYERFRSSDGRVVVLYLRLLRNEDDNLAWRELLRLRGFGDQPVLALREEARMQAKTFVQLLNDVHRRGNETGIPRAASVAKFVTYVLAHIEDIRAAETGDVKRELESLVGTIAVADAEIVRLLMQAASELAAETLAPVRLTDLPNVLAGQRSGIDDEVAEATGVRVMTMHNAKGLTADSVIIAGADHGVLHAHSDPQDDPEEIRLVYVSATRARHELVVTFAGRRTGEQAYYAGHGPQRLSNVLSRAGLDCH